jgi:hypothetical protein
LTVLCACADLAAAAWSAAVPSGENMYDKSVDTRVEGRCWSRDSWDAPCTADPSGAKLRLLALRA